MTPEQKKPGQPEAEPQDDAVDDAGFDDDGRDDVLGDNARDVDGQDPDQAGVVADGPWAGQWVAGTPVTVPADPGPDGAAEADNPSSFQTSSWSVQAGLPPEQAPPMPVAPPAGGAENDDVTADDEVTANRASSRRAHDAGPEPAAALTADRLLTQTNRPPVGGWRRWLYAATFGYLNLGDSEKVRIQRALEHRIGVRLGGRTRYIPILSRKGGVGKTTVTTLLGMTLAEIREDRVIAVDANPDRGTLSDRSPGSADHTARQLVHDRFAVDSFAQLSNYVAREGSRLDVLASDTDPTVAQAFDEVDYRAVTEILDRYYSVVLTDSGTGMVHSVMKGTLEKADTVVLVSGGSVDEARLASETLSWLEAHDRHDLVAKAIVVINMSSGGGSLVDVAQIEEHFQSRVRTVVKIPYDRHLAEGSRIELAKLRPATRTAAVELAALVVDELQS
ncbi:MAG TPA: MinD/ParA family protein [Arthrobacter sp.]|nr:MinD/ParA family protein [Arthrobacter sp.]